MPSQKTRRLNRSILALLTSEFLATAAGIAGITVIGKQVYDLTHRDIDLGLLGLVEFAPSALLVILSGAVADKFDRRKIVALATAGEGVGGLLLAWYASTTPTAVAPIFIIMFLIGIARAFVGPASRALIADTVVPEDFSWLIPRWSATWQLALIAGPILGGFLYVWNTSAPYLMMSVFLAIASVVTLSVEIINPHSPATTASTETVLRTSETVSAEPERSGFREALQGFRVVRDNPVLLGAISLDLFAVLFGGAVALLPALASDRYHVGAVGLGWLRAAGGIGAGLVTLSLAWKPLKRNVGRSLFLVVAMFGVVTIILGTTRNYGVAFVAMLLLSGADAISVFIRATLVPLVAPDDKRGRVMALETVFIGASNELGAFESGVAGQILGSGPAVVVGGIGTLVVAATWSAIFPSLRRIDSFPEKT